MFVKMNFLCSATSTGTRNQHTQHAPCGENGHRHTETYVKANPDSGMQLGSQAVMWQLRNLHIPKRKNPTRNDKNINPTNTFT
jgi:hypothetical protein